VTTPEWVVAPGLTPYPDAVAGMEARVAAIRAGEAPERIWLVEHPPLYTAGVGARDGDLLDAARFPVFETGRGGKHTYHGPGQRVAYVMLDLAAALVDRDGSEALSIAILGVPDGATLSAGARAVDGSWVLGAALGLLAVKLATESRT